MSYILEALKKSQQERELGQVPRLQAPTLDDPSEPSAVQPWVVAALGLASLAVILALYAALQSSRPAEPPMEASLSLGAQSGEASDVDAQTSSPVLQPTIDVAVTEAKPVPPISLDDPADLSVEPQVLVVPAPPKPGERLPRGADELRRAVLGPEVSPSIESRRAERPSRASASEFTPVPPELIAEIEDFKRTYQQGGSPPARNSQGARATDQPGTSAVPGSNPESTRKWASADGGADGGVAGSATASTGKPAPLTGTLRRQLPPFSMTVHVFDKEPSRRFVYLNGSKVREGELSRDGFFVEQVLADGAIVRYDDHRFFQSP